MIKLLTQIQDWIGSAEAAKRGLSQGHASQLDSVYDASNFRNRIRNHSSFKAGLKELGIEEVTHGNRRHHNALAKITQPFGPLEGAEYIADV